MSASEIRKQAKDVKKNINLAKHNTELNFLEEFILKQCYSSKKYIYDFLSKILDIQNEEFTIQKYSTLFWSNFFKIIKNVDSFPDKDTIIISIKSKVKTRKTTKMKKKSNTTMKDMTKQMIKTLNL